MPPVLKGWVGPVLASLLLVAWLLLAYRLSVHVVVGNSDDANTVLAGADMVHGNVLLKGWVLPPDPFWTGDLPVAGVLALVVGTGPVLIHLVPVVIAGLTAVVIAWLCGSGVRHPWLAAVPVVAVLGLPTPLESVFWLQSPMHVMTILYCLVAFGCLARRPSWGWWSAGTGALLLALVGDSTAYAIGVAPVVVTAVVIGLRSHGRQRALYALGAASTAGVLAPLVLKAVAWAGGFRAAPALAPVPASRWLPNLGRALSRLADVLGFSTRAPLSGELGLAHWIHLLGLAGVATGVLFGLWSIVQVRPDAARDWLFGFLSTGALAGMGVFALLSPAGALGATDRYLLPTVIMGATAAGLAAGTLVWNHRRRTAAGAAAALVLGLYLVTPLQSVFRASPADPGRLLSVWLQGQRLSHGVGTYWDASYVTLMGRGRVVVRPVVDVDGRLHGYRYFVRNAWFEEPALLNPQFLVFETRSPWGGVDMASASATLGRPGRVATVGPYTVLIWPTKGRETMPPGGPGGIGPPVAITP